MYNHELRRLVALLLSPPTDNNEQRELDLLMHKYDNRRALQPAIDFVHNVCRKIGVDHADILSDSRNRPLPQIRHVLMSEVRQRFPDLSLPQIGSIFNRKHCTVIHGCRSANNPHDTYIAMIRERIASVVDAPVRMKFNDSHPI